MATAYPFRRVYIDHRFHANSVIWWELAADFADEGPHRFMVQASYTDDPYAPDWMPVSGVVENAPAISCPLRRDMRGKQILSHYRVVLMTPHHTYFSSPTPVRGQLDARDWNIAREIVRKENVQAKLANSPGFLLRKLRYGQQSENTDELAGGITDSSHPSSYGTAFVNGYYRPVCYSILHEPKMVREQRGGDNPQTHSSDMRVIRARTLTAPIIAKDDVWVDAYTDERWVADGIAITASVRGVPLILTVDFLLLPHTDTAYRIPLPADDPPDPGLTPGTGPFLIDHNTPEEDSLQYVAPDNEPIADATITAFRRRDWADGLRYDANAVAQTTTGEDGRWLLPLRLECGEYVLRLYKPQCRGPNLVAMSIPCPDSPNPLSLTLLDNFGFVVEDYAGTPITTEIDDGSWFRYVPSEQDETNSAADFGLF